MEAGIVLVGPIPMSLLSIRWHRDAAAKRHEFRSKERIVPAGQQLVISWRRLQLLETFQSLRSQYRIRDLVFRYSEAN